MLTDRRWPPRLSRRSAWVERGGLRVVAATERFAAGREYLRDTADLDAPRPPRRHGCEVIDDEGNTRARLRIAKLLAFREAMTADVDRVLVGVVPEAHGYDVRLTGSADGCDSSEALAPEVRDLSWCEDAHIRRLLLLVP